MAKETKISKMRKMLQDGAIAQWYTLNGWFVRIYPALGIDKVRFSFVEKGKQGTGFDVYVDTLDFQLLCDDIKSGMMRRLIAEDKGQYPAAWTYRTGENASKTIAIGKSRNGGVLISGSDNMKKMRGNIPLTGYDDLREMALLFDVITGRYAGSGYWNEIREFYEDCQKNNPWHPTEVDEKTEAPAGENTIADSAKVYECRVIRAPEQTDTPQIRKAVVETQGRSLSVWIHGEHQKAREMIAAASTGDPVFIPIEVKCAEDGTKTAWLAG